MKDFDDLEERFAEVELDSKEQTIEVIAIVLTLLLLVGSFLKIVFL